MCGYDPFWLYEAMLDIEAEMNDLGITDYNEWLKIENKEGKENE